MNWKNINYNLRFFILLACAALVQIYLFNEKYIFHIDEILSLEQANSQNGLKLFLFASEIDDKLLNGQFFWNYLHRSDNFTFIKMWENLKFDTHMPIYFALLYFTSSFFLSEFSFIPGFIINILSLIVVLYSFYKLSKKVFRDNEIALTITTLLAFLSPVLGLEIFIRMYLLQMACCLFLLLKIYYFLFIETDNKNNTWLLLSILVSSIITILTHFYSIVFCFFVTISGALILYMQKKHSKNFIFCFIMLLSVLIAIFIYPEMIKVGTNGERGSQFWGIISNYSSDPLPLLKKQLQLFIKPLFGNYIFAFISMLLFFIIIFIANKKNILDSSTKQNIIFFNSIFFLYGISLALVMPNMTNFQIRYFAPIIPIYVILMGYFIVYLLKIFNTKQMLIYIITWMIVFSNAFYEATHQDNPFYMRGNILNRKVDRLVKNADIWWALGGGNQHSWILQNYIHKLMYADNIWTLVDRDNKEFKDFSDTEIKQKKYAYLFMPKTQEIQPEGAIEWIKENTGRTSYYLFTVKNEETASMTFEASVFLVCPY